MLTALALESTLAGISGGRWMLSLSFSQASLYFICQREKMNRNINIHFWHKYTKCEAFLNLHVKVFRMLGDNIAYITEVFSILLGQDNSWKVNNAGELHGAWWLAVEPFIENILAMSSLEHIHRVLRWPAASPQPLHVSFVDSLSNKGQVKPYG